MFKVMEKEEGRGQRISLKPTNKNYDGMNW
jgi:hypothetical protein